MTFVINRIRVFVFGIAVALLGLWSPSKALQTVHDVLDVLED